MIKNSVHAIFVLRFIDENSYIIYNDDKTSKFINVLFEIAGLTKVDTKTIQPFVTRLISQTKTKRLIFLKNLLETKSLDGVIQVCNAYSLAPVNSSYAKELRKLYDANKYTLERDFPK